MHILGGQFSDLSNSLYSRCLLAAAEIHEYDIPLLAIFNSFFKALENASEGILLGGKW